MTKFTVALEDGTVGAVCEEVEIGETVTVSLRDENGMPIQKTGVVAEVL